MKLNTKEGERKVAKTLNVAFRGHSSARPGRGFSAIRAAVFTGRFTGGQSQALADNCAEYIGRVFLFRQKSTALQREE